MLVLRYLVIEIENAITTNFLNQMTLLIMMFKYRSLIDSNSFDSGSGSCSLISRNL